MSFEDNVANTNHTQICQWQRFGHMCTIMIDLQLKEDITNHQLIATGLPTAVFGQPMWNLLMCSSDQYTIGVYVNQYGELRVIKGNKSISYKDKIFYGSVTYICHIK